MSYPGRVCARAWADTKADLIEDRRRLVIRGLVLVATILVLWAMGLNEVLLEELNIWLASFVGVLFIGVFLFAWNLVLAPFRIDAEQLGEIATQGELIANLKEELRPKIRLHYALDELDCAHETRIGGRPGWFFRVRVEASEPVTCRAYLVDIIRDGRQLNAAGSVSLTIAPAEQDDPLTKTVIDGVPAYVDVGFIIKTDNLFRLGTRYVDGQRPVPSVIMNVFNDPGLYELGIVVSEGRQEIREDFGAAR